MFCIIKGCYSREIVIKRRVGRETRAIYHPVHSFKNNYSFNDSLATHM